MSFGYFNNNPTGAVPGSPGYDANISNVHFDVGNNFAVNVPATSTSYQAHTNVWHTVRLVSDYSGTGTQVVGQQCLSTDSAGTLKVYLDGVLQRRETAVGRVPAVASAGASFDFANGFLCGTEGAPLGIGKARRSRGFALGRAPNGALGGTNKEEINIDYIRVWHEALPLVPTCGGDVSGSVAGVPDGTTDGADLAYLYNHWGAVPVGTLGDIAGTTGPDGVVDGADVGKVYNCWAQADGAPASVPEPASLGMIGLGLAGLLATRRRS